MKSLIPSLATLRSSISHAAMSMAVALFVQAALLASIFTDSWRSVLESTVDWLKEHIMNLIGFRIYDLDALLFLTVVILPFIFVAAAFLRGLFVLQGMHRAGLVVPARTVQILMSVCVLLLFLYISLPLSIVAILFSGEWLGLLYAFILFGIATTCVYLAVHVRQA